MAQFVGRNLYTHMFIRFMHTYVDCYFDVYIEGSPDFSFALSPRILRTSTESDMWLACTPRPLYLILQATVTYEL